MLPIPLTAVMTTTKTVHWTVPLRSQTSVQIRLKVPVGKEHDDRGIDRDLYSSVENETRRHTVTEKNGDDCQSECDRKLSRKISRLVFTREVVI